MEVNLEVLDSAIGGLPLEEKLKIVDEGHVILQALKSKPDGVGKAVITLAIALAQDQPIPIVTQTHALALGMAMGIRYQKAIQEVGQLEDLTKVS